MQRLMRRAAVMGVVAALAYGVGACGEQQGNAGGSSASTDPINQQNKPPADPGARPDTTGTTDPKLASPISQESGDPKGEATGGAGLAPSTAPGNSLSRTDGGEPAGARGMAGTGSLQSADGGTSGMDAGTSSEVRRRQDAGMGSGTGTRAVTPDAGAAR